MQKSKAMVNVSYVSFTLLKLHFALEMNGLLKALSTVKDFKQLKQSKADFPSVLGKEAAVAKSWCIPSVKPWFKVVSCDSPASRAPTVSRPLRANKYCLNIIYQCLFSSCYFNTLW